jgi:D-alanyl-D-alanine dipeptidase
LADVAIRKPNANQFIQIPDFQAFFVISLLNSFGMPLRILLFVFAPLFAVSQSVTNLNPYGLELTNSIEKYHEDVLSNPDNELINLIDLIPGLVLDIRYATHNNFTNEIVYELPLAFLRRPVAEALADVQNELEEHGLGLKIFDAYRPYQATLKFWNLIGNTQFVAAPWKGSRHNRGAAVDLTIIVLKTGKELEMPTAFDAFTEKASPDYNQLPEYQIVNRNYLIKIMRRHGFRVFPSEWWHFDYKHWENYNLVDLPFDQLITNKISAN